MTTTPFFAPDGPSGPLTASLLDLPAALRRMVLVDDILARLADALAADPGDIGADARFTDLGIDSKRALEIKEDLEEALGRPLPATLLFDHPTPDRLAGHILDGLPDRAPASITPAADAAGDEADDPSAALDAALARYGL